MTKNEEEIKICTARKTLYAICKGVMLLLATTPPSPIANYKPVFTEDPSSQQSPPPPTSAHTHTEHHETRLRH